MRDRSYDERLPSRSAETRKLPQMSSVSSSSVRNHDHHVTHSLGLSRVQPTKKGGGGERRGCKREERRGERRGEEGREGKGGETCSENCLNPDGHQCSTLPTFVKTKTRA